MSLKKKQIIFRVSGLDNFLSDQASKQNMIFELAKIFIVINKALMDSPIIVSFRIKYCYTYVVFKCSIPSAGKCSSDPRFTLGKSQMVKGDRNKLAALLLKPTKCMTDGFITSATGASLLSFKLCQMFLSL